MQAAINFRFSMYPCRLPPFAFNITVIFCNDYGTLPPASLFLIALLLQNRRLLRIMYFSIQGHSVTRNTEIPEKLLANRWLWGHRCYFSLFPHGSLAPKSLLTASPFLGQNAGLYRQVANAAAVLPLFAGKASAPSEPYGCALRESCRLPLLRRVHCAPR